MPFLAIRSARRRGAATVEMAVVAPVIFLLVIGAVEFGRVMMVSNVLTAAAREGARVAIVPGGSNTDVTTAVNSHLTGNGVSSSTPNLTTKVYVNGVEKDASNAVTGDQVTVEVRVQYGNVCLLPTPFFLSATQQLGGSAVMRHE